MSIRKRLSAALRRLVRRPVEQPKAKAPGASEASKDAKLDQASGGKVQMQDFHFG